MDRRERQLVDRGQLERRPGADHRRRCLHQHAGKVGIDLSSGGTLTLAGGTLDGGGTVRGGTLAAAGGQFNPNGLDLDAVAYQGTLQLSGSDSLRLSGGTTVRSATGGAGVIALGGPAQLTTDAATNLANTTVRVQGGTLRLAGAVNNRGRIAISNGDQVAVTNGYLTNATGGVIDVGSGVLSVLSTTVGESAALTNAAGATINVNSGRDRR